VAVKKTIAIIGSTNEKATAIVSRLYIEDYRLLLVSKSANQFVELAKEIQCGHPEVALEIVECMKDGCWEADIIIIDVENCEEKKVAELIREVATQKIVINFSESENEFGVNGLQNLLKYSKVVVAHKKINSSIIFLYGEDENAVREVSHILKNSKQINRQLN
jgi:hypothetical protein